MQINAALKFYGRIMNRLFIGLCLASVPGKARRLLRIAG